MRMLVTLMAAVAMPTPAMAEPQSQAQLQAKAGATAPAPDEIDPDRLAAARALIDVLMPAATREQMVDAMMKPMLANLSGGFTQNPEFAAMLGSDPRVKAAFDAFMAKQQARSVAMMHEALPGMVPAMARAYARRFDVAQLREIRAFFETPTGRTYMQTAVTIMSDPDVAAWQRDMMTRSLATMKEDVTVFTQQLQTLGAKKP